MTTTMPPRYTVLSIGPAGVARIEYETDDRGDALRVADRLHRVRVVEGRRRECIGVIDAESPEEWVNHDD